MDLTNELLKQIQHEMEIMCSNFVGVDNMHDTMEKTWINQMVQTIGLKNVVNYTLENNDLGCASLLYKYNKKRLHRLGKKYYLIESLAVAYELVGENNEH